MDRSGEHATGIQISDMTHLRQSIRKGVILASTKVRGLELAAVREEVVDQIMQTLGYEGEA